MPISSIDDDEASTGRNKKEKSHDSKPTGTQPDTPFSLTPSIKFSRYRKSQATRSDAEDVVPIPTFSFNAGDNALSPATTSTGHSCSKSSNNNRAAAARASNTAVTPTPQTQVAIKREETVATPASTPTKSVACKEEFSNLLLESLQSQDSKIVAIALKDLALKIKECPPADVLEHFFLLGGHTLLALALTKWKSNQAVQAMGCCCIVRLISWAKVHTNDADQNGGLAAKSVDLLHLVGAVDLATHALKTFPNRAKVQFYGLGAIGNMLHPKNDTDAHRVAAKRFVEQLDGIAIITKAMATFPERELVQEIALWVLKRLGELGMGRSAQLKEKAIVLVATAAQNFPNNEEIDEYTRAFMKDAFSRDD